LSQAKLIKLLWDGAYTLKELAAETGLHYLTVAEYCRSLQKEGMAHICMWMLDDVGRHSLRVYKLGPGQDAPRQKLSQVERTRRTRAKQKAKQVLAVHAGKGTFIKVGNGRLRFQPVEEMA